MDLMYSINVNILIWDVTEQRVDVTGQIIYGSCLVYFVHQGEFRICSPMGQVPPLKIYEHLGD